MWVFTKYGFYSVVSAQRDDKARLRSVDPDRVMVRGRLVSHLEPLRNRFHGLLVEYEIQETTSANYSCRMLLPKDTWVEVLQALAEETAYESFNTEVAEFQRHAGRDYLKMLQDSWEASAQLEKHEH